MNIVENIFNHMATRMDDYVHLLSKPHFYVTHNYWSYLMCTLKWDPLFDPQEDTLIAIAWIYFPLLPLIFSSFIFGSNNRETFARGSSIKK